MRTQRRGWLIQCVASDRVGLAVEAEGSGPSLYALHGGPANDRGEFGSYLSPVADYRRLHLLDARRCGDSEGAPVESYTIELLAEDVEDVRRQLGDGMRRLSLRPVIAAGRPVAGFYGRQDYRFLGEVARLRSIGAGVVLIDRAGHLPFLEQPEAFHRSLREFLETTRS